MSEAGYTLAETLAAMAILGLAMGGLTLSLQVVGRLQFSATDRLSKASQERSAQDLFARLVERSGAFGAHQPERLAGDAHGVRFDCAGEQPCRVALEDNASQMLIVDGDGTERRLRLEPPGDYRFVYQGRLSASDVWPPIEPGRQNLRAISLLAGFGADERVALSVRVWEEQPAACAYDPVIGDCR